MRGVSVSYQADLYPSLGVASDSDLLAFHRAGVDILGPFSRAIGGYCFLYVAIEKFTKRAEATVVTTINKASIVKFLKSIICCFSILNRIITDHRSQFRSKVFQEYCADIKIKVCYTSITRPKSNG